MNHDGFDPLYESLVLNELEIAKLLLDAGANVNQDRCEVTLLMNLVEKKQKDQIKFLLETGKCDLTLQDKNKKTILDYAKETKDQEIIDLFK